MNSGVEHVVVSGPLLLVIRVARAAGVVWFISPCVFPLVPGHISYVTGIAGAGLQHCPSAAPPQAAGSAGGEAAVATAAAGKNLRRTGKGWSVTDALPRQRAA